MLLSELSRRHLFLDESGHKLVVYVKILELRRFFTFLKIYLLSYLAKSAIRPVIMT